MFLISNLLGLWLKANENLKFSFSQNVIIIAKTIMGCYCDWQTVLDDLYKEVKVQMVVAKKAHHLQNAWKYINWKVEWKEKLW